MTKYINVFVIAVDDVSDPAMLLKYSEINENKGVRSHTTRRKNRQVAWIG